MVMKIKDDYKLYFFWTSLFIILGLLIYVSHNLTPKEEYIEVYWQIFKITPVKELKNITCFNDICQKSETYQIGILNLDNREFEVLFLNDTVTGEYDSICIDIDHNMTFCEEQEGPFRPDDSFLINSHGFTIMLPKEDFLPIFKFPKKTQNSSFIVSTAIKSHYKSSKSLDLDLLVNTTLLEERTILVDPQQELILNFDIDLPSEGLSLVELVFNIEDVENSIYFSVNYTDNQRKTLP